MEAIEKIENQTTIIITHILNTIKNCKKIIIIDKGKIEVIKNLKI